MAELLIKAVDAVHSDTQKNQRGCYKRGDVVVVMPDGHPWGTEERPPKFVTMRVVGVLPARYQRLVEQAETVILDPEGNPVRLRRRHYSLDLSQLPAGARNRLTSGEILEVSETQLRSLLVDAGSPLGARTRPVGF